MFRLFHRKDTFLPRLSWFDGAVLVAGVGAYIGLAVSTISKFSVWFDEGFGSYLIRFDFVSLTRYTANDVHPPLYYWLLKLWSMAFGNSEVGIRSMSVFFAALTIIVAFLFVLRQFGRRAAYLSLVFLVLTPLFMRFGQEARMYTLLTAIIMSATYVLVYAVETKKRVAWIWYGVLVAMGMLTQYLAALAWVAHVIWLFVESRQPSESFRTTTKRLLNKNIVTAYSVALLVFCLWLPFLVIQFLTIQGHGFWIKQVSLATIPDFLTDVLLFTDSTSTQSWFALGVLLLSAGTAYYAYRMYSTFKGSTRSTYLLVILMVVIPPALLFVMSMPPLRSAFVDRYLMISAVSIALLLGITAATMWRRIGQKRMGVVVIAVITILSFGIYNQATIGNYNKSSGQSNNTRQLLEAVRAKAPAGTPILATTPWIFYEAAIYDRPDSPIYYVNETTQYKYGSLTALAENEIHKIRDLDGFSAQHKDIWVIGNLRDTAPRALRSSWHEQESIVINDDLTKKALFKATHFSVE